MNCPACESELTEVDAGKITVDACKSGCGGIWFDRFELEKVRDGSDVEGQSLLAIGKGPKKVDPTRRRKCPKCDVVMMQHFESVMKKVTVDQCPKCNGYWLDAGELQAIREEYRTESDRSEAAEAFCGDMVNALRKRK